MNGHFSLWKHEKHNLMINMNENCRKEYKQPEMQIVEIELADIIATSNPTGGTDSFNPNA